MLQHFSKGPFKASNHCLGMCQLVTTKGLGTHPGPSKGCFVPGALPVESDKQLVFLYAARIEIFPMQVFVLTFPLPQSRCLSPLLLCSWGAPLLCHLHSSSRANVVATAVTWWPPVPSSGGTGGRLEKVLLLLGGSDLAPVLPGGRVCIQAGPGALPAPGRGTALAAACWTSAWRDLEGCCLWYHPPSLARNDGASLEGWAVDTSLVLSSKQDLKKGGGK